MSFFNKVLASVGIGNAIIDTKLKSATFVQGEEMRGFVEVQGGNVEQHIEEIYLNLNTHYTRELNDQNITEIATVAQFLITEPFTIGPNENKSIPFSVVLPLDTPITVGKSGVWVSTVASIKSAVDPSDKDAIHVLSAPIVAEILESMEELGFGIRKAINKATPRGVRYRLPFIQELEYVPHRGLFSGRLDEVEVSFIPQSQNRVDVIIEVDRKARFTSITSMMAEAMDMDEVKTRVTITTNDIPNMTEKLHNIIHALS